MVVVVVGPSLIARYLAFPPLRYRKLMLRPDALMQAAQQRGHKGIVIERGSQLKLSCRGAITPLSVTGVRSDSLAVSRTTEPPS